MKSFTINVSDGTLDFQFVTVNRATFVSAIEVLSSSSILELAKGGLSGKADF